MNEVPPRGPFGRAKTKAKHARPHADSQAVVRQARLRTRRFVRNAGRDGRQRVEGLYKIGLRQARCIEQSNRRREADAMTRRAVPTFVVGIMVVTCPNVGVRHRVTIVMMVVSHSGVTVAHVGSRCTDLRCSTRGRPADHHGCRRVCLKGHRKHHEPQQDRAKADHG